MNFLLTLDVKSSGVDTAVCATYLMPPLQLHLYKQKRLQYKGKRRVSKQKDEYCKMRRLDKGDP